MGKEGKAKERGFSGSFVTGAVAMVFMIIGYQTALFIHRAAVTEIAAGRDTPDTVFVCIDGEQSAHDKKVVRILGYKDAIHSDRVAAVRAKLPRRHADNFMFDPNSVSEEDLCRLGFTPKQSQAIINYRNKGGRFRRKEDFAKSFVVSDSIYRRLEPYICIPKLDLNMADSADFDALPGIGGWFASRMIVHREALGGYSYPEQLMDIRGFDIEKFAALEDLVSIGEENVTPYPLWTLPADTLMKHPYIGSHETARAIILYRENNPQCLWTVSGLESSGVISSECAEKLSRCRIASP